jgi:hypothetical protein
MMDGYKNAVPAFTFDPITGQRTAQEQIYTEASFESLVIGPAKQPGQVRLANVVFSHCNVRPGCLAIRSGAHLKDVTFDSVLCAESVTVSTNALLDKVTFEGTHKSGGLWVRPDEVFDEHADSALRAWVAEEFLGIEWMLDISRYDAEHVEVYGLPLEMIRWNPEKHIVIDCEDASSIDWAELGIPRHSPARLAFRRLRTYNQTKALVGLPWALEAREQFLMELDLLKAKGLAR